LDIKSLRELFNVQLFALAAYASVQTLLSRVIGWAFGAQRKNIGRSMPGHGASSDQANAFGNQVWILGVEVNAPPSPGSALTCIIELRRIATPFCVMGP
jgi:hypothetical protein